MSASDQMLPGLDDLSPTTSKLELAARRQLKALDEKGLLNDSNAITVQLILDLAAVVGQSCAHGKAAAAALASQRLLEALDMLPDPDANGLDTVVAELRAVS